MTGAEYTRLIAAYIVHNFRGRNVAVYCEVDLGKSIIGKRRRVDLFVHETQLKLALAIEGKFQGTLGTTDEKIPYTLQDLDSMRTSGCLVYAGTGWSDGVRHMLEGSPLAAFSLPSLLPGLDRNDQTRELDHCSRRRSVGGI